MKSLVIKLINKLFAFYDSKCNQSLNNRDID
jgi:hypothetical protein